MKIRSHFQTFKFITALAVLCGFALSSHAVDIVRDTWQDAERTNPVAPVYSENGTDSDSDTDLESAWYQGGVGGLIPTVGNLSMTNGTTSSSFTTHFTPEASPLNLSAAGNQIKITWVFTPTNVTATGTSQNFRLAAVDCPSAQRLTNDAAPPPGAYTGYAMFMNMRSGTLGNGNSFALMERNTASANLSLLSASGAWLNVTNGANSSTAGYTSGTQYTFVMTLTRNGSSGIDITASMAGTGLGPTGLLAVAHTDTTPDSFAFDTFSIRPSTEDSTATAFDTSLFRVEFTGTIISDPWANFQAFYGITNGDLDPDGDGVSNTNEFLASFKPNSSASAPRILNITRSGSDMVISYLGANGDSSYSGGPASRTNILEVSTGSGAEGSYPGTFVTTGVTNVLSGGTGNGAATTATDVGGASPGPSRYYRIRVIAP